MPIDLAFVRDTDVPKVIFNGSPASVGIASSNRLWEAGLENAGEEICIYPGESGPYMYFGAYRRTADKITTLEDLDGKLIATKYPRIVQESMNRRGLSAKVEEFSGGIEGRDIFYPGLVGLMDVVSSGKTARANGIKIIEIFYKISTRMIDAPGKMTPLELSIYEDLREIIEVALLKKSKAE